jgi:hypothetical protein
MELRFIYAAEEHRHIFPKIKISAINLPIFALDGGLSCKLQF